MRIVSRFLEMMFQKRALLREVFPETVFPGMGLQVMESLCWQSVDLQKYRLAAALS